MDFIPGTQWSQDQTSSWLHWTYQEGRLQQNSGKVYSVKLNIKSNRVKIRERG